MSGTGDFKHGAFYKNVSPLAGIALQIEWLAARHAGDDQPAGPGFARAEELEPLECLRGGDGRVDHAAHAIVQHNQRQRERDKTRDEQRDGRTLQSEAWNKPSTKNENRIKKDVQYC